MQKNRSDTRVFAGTGVSAGIRIVIGLTLAVGFLVTLAGATGPAVGQQGDTKGEVMGKTTFMTYCRSCHGDSARGDGPVAEHLNVRPADLTGIKQRNGGTFPAGEVYAKIDGREKVKAHGTSEMPVWGDAFTRAMGGQTEEQVAQRIQDLVAYLASIQR